MAHFLAMMVFLSGIFCAANSRKAAPRVRESSLINQPAAVLPADRNYAGQKRPNLLPATVPT
jgi:hypothetical protein